VVRHWSPVAVPTAGVWMCAQPVLRVKLAPTWRGPLPTAMGEHRIAYAWARGLIGTPMIGEAFCRLNTLRCVIDLVYRRHVYSEPGRITPPFIAKKQGVARRRGARFGSVAFVTGNLDPPSDRDAFIALFDRLPMPTLVLCGNATPPRSKAEMAALAGQSDIDPRWAGGSLGLHEECAHADCRPDRSLRRRILGRAHGETAACRPVSAVRFYAEASEP
jgi:hypothetical protein